MRSAMLQSITPWHDRANVACSNVARSRRRRRKRIAQKPTTTMATAAVAGTEAGPERCADEENSDSNDSTTTAAAAAAVDRAAATSASKFLDCLGRPNAFGLTVALLLLTTTTCCLCTPISPCDSSSWWHPAKDVCVPCTLCVGEMIPLRPCQQHRDTICGSIYDLKIDWVVLSKTEPNWKERRKNAGGDLGADQHHKAAPVQLSHLTPEQLQQLQYEDGVTLDWQTSVLIVAVIACLIFFIVAASVLVHHMRQWRRLERRLDQDVEELSTKLMAKLAEVQSLEGGTLFIGNADALCLPAATTMTATIFQPQRVLLPEKSTKQPGRRTMKQMRPGNVYIEESSIKP